VGALFWISLVAIVYPYAIYPLLLVGWNRLARRSLPQPDPAYRPSVSVIMPVHNEAGRIPGKIANLLALDYPREQLQIIVVGDACTDDSLQRAQAAGGDAVQVIALAQRNGKAAGLNAGLARATGEIVVFTDAGILLDRGALAALVGHFADPSVGAVSGEDYVEGGGSEGAYGKLELLLRREEARLHSIAGASGCFYGQRRALCKPFVPGYAPDFLSVLETVRSGHRALCEPLARGSMTATSNQRAEFTRKTRTFLRGLTALFGNADLLLPFRSPAFAFILWSHKLMRWLGPVALVGCLVSAWALRDIPFYAVAFALQVAAYLLAAAGLLLPALAERFVPARIAAFFVLVNAAAAKALAMWLVGIRQEVWAPTRRPA
jgi:cellulose synthase/poly-beta-1,6-N-acetylglucosamine synthase-like glycosyltransferase